ncbi:MAG: type II secretion system protein [Phycisphaerales bacterium]
MTTTTTNRPIVRRGFTLVEALVAVFAIALISVGLATIFASVGDTVERGRRISAINQYAAVIERQMREDIASMTREGFLVIRNEYAGGPDRTEIRVSPEAADTARPRRIDEMLFFARGSFESARSPINADFRPRASAARIYYGHGQQQLEGATGFFRPLLNDPNADATLRLGLAPTVDPTNPVSSIGAANPNFYAGDWTLLRGVTLLARPERSFFSRNPDVFDATPAEAQAQADNELQIDLYTAADSVFRSMAVWGNPDPLEFPNPSAITGNDFASYSARLADVPPTFSSGVVDIATESLGDIKKRVTAIDLVETPTQGRVQISLDTPAALFADQQKRPYYTTGSLLQRISRISPAQFHAIRIAEARATGGNTLLMGEGERLQELVHAQHAWMTDALPGASNELTWRTIRRGREEPEVVLVQRDNRGAGTGDPFEPAYPFRTRMRYEQTPPGYNAAVFGEDIVTAALADGSGAQSRVLAASRADQQMVAASQFIPRCTEFIVEWSFGERATPETSLQFGVPVGELIWYGAPREDATAVVASLRPGVSGPAGRTRPDRDPEVVIDELPQIDGSDVPAPDEQRLLERHLRADLIVGFPLGGGRVGNGGLDQARWNDPFEYPTTYHFGYADPRAMPVLVSSYDADGSGVIDPDEFGNNAGFDINGDGYRDDIDGDGVYDDAWPWPTLIRVTMSFADPVDQSIEETFQLVFDVPQDAGL